MKNLTTPRTLAECQWITSYPQAQISRRDRIGGRLLEDAFRCIAPVCEPLGCSDCNCAVPADVYAALGKAFAAMERERIARSFDVPAHIHGEAEDWCRAAANDIRSGLK